MFSAKLNNNYYNNTKHYDVILTSNDRGDHHEAPEIVYREWRLIFRNVLPDSCLKQFGVLQSEQLRRHSQKIAPTIAETRRSISPNIVTRRMNDGVVNGGWMKR